MNPRSQPQRPSPEPSLPTQGGLGSLGQRNGVVLRLGTHAPLVGTNWWPRTEGRLSQSPVSTWDPAVPPLEIDPRETPVNAHMEQVPGRGATLFQQRPSARQQGGDCQYLLFRPETTGDNPGARQLTGTSAEGSLRYGAK